MATKKKSSTTTKSKKRNKRPGGPIANGSPITIGGGGGGIPEQYCEFDEGDYPNQTGGSSPGMKIFGNPDLQMTSLTIEAAGTQVVLDSLLQGDGKCKIKVQCKGTNEHFEMYGNHVDHGMAIKFHTGRYSEINGNRRSKYDPANWVRSVKVESRLGKFERTYQAGEDCLVYAVGE